jgi:hypothetical protein
MSILQLNLGTYPNDGQGDDLRTAFQKTIDNFDYLDLVKIEDGENLGLSQPNTHGVYANKAGATLRFKSIKQGDNVTITSDGNIITIRPKDSINAVEEDSSPTLGGDLDINGNNIVGEGNISIEGEVTADFFTGDLEGTVYGDVFGDLTGTVTGSLFGPVTGDVTGNVLGNLTGNVTGNVLGNLTGNVTGQVSDISNHVLSSLGDVGNTVPTTGQVLSWSGSQWNPATVTSGVSRIVAGTNITISPSNGLGEVTINATGGGSITEINTFDFGNFTNTFTNPITYLLNQVGVDFGSFTAPSQFTIDLGSF